MHPKLVFAVKTIAELDAASYALTAQAHNFPKTRLITFPRNIVRPQFRAAIENSSMPQHIDPGHTQIRSALRLVGPVVVAVGLLFTAIGIGSFFSSFGTFSPPRYFWCAFVGIPMIGFGAAICKFAFMGPVSRYMANEVAPVGRDVVNYMADGTQSAVRTVAAAVGQGLSASQAVSGGQIVLCPVCQEQNETDANYCKGCGNTLRASVACSKCGEANDADARFCDNCGQQLA